MGSMVLTPSIALQASSKGLKLYLIVDTNLNDDVIINTYQYGDRVFTHDAVIHSVIPDTTQKPNNEQTTTIINCPPDSRCVIEQ